MSVTQPKLHAKLNELLEVLASANAIVNGHVASFITKKLWTEALPASVVQELENLPNMASFVPMYFKYLADNSSLDAYPQLSCYLQNSLCSSLNSCVTSINQLYSQLNLLGISCESNPEIKDFMTEKKKHEVQQMVPLGEMLAKVTGTPYVVDIGGGKGYLSATLAKECSLQVLALDSSSATTDGAEKLEKKMARTASSNTKDLHKFLRETILVNTETKLSSIASRCFGPDNVTIGLVGLHTCGDLSAICLHHFLRDEVAWIMNVGCCYHFIHEEFEKMEFSPDSNCTDYYGFPMSSWLKEKKVKLGRNARMLAAHSLEKIMHDGVSQEATKSLYYRALLQVIIERVRGNNVVEGRIGKLASKCDSFHQYVRRAIQKLQLNINLSDQNIEDILNEYAAEETKLQIFFFLRIHYAPIIEAVILLDRVLFLLEQGLENVYLVPLFNPILSPRNHAIVAWKASKNSVLRSPLN